MADPRKVAAGSSGAAPSGEEPSAGGDDAETQVAGAPTAIELLRAEHCKWEVDEAVRRAKANAANFDKFERLSVQLSHLMGVVGDMHAKLAAEEKAKEPPAPAAPAEAASAPGSDVDAGRDGVAGRVRSFEAMKDARKLGGGCYMGKVRGETPPDDPTAPPSKRLEAQMADDASRPDKTVRRSSIQVRAKARSIAEEISGSSEEILGMIGSRGCSLAERYGVP